ncbi:M20 family metallo-hydrolase [Cupriavidus pampae]|uniref:N-carbamoyl-L-amino-acid hydrolase n=1 Tax=Cupriavidus pampae TaxID=659251 RepID=A0ABN7ZKV5_9BURK|nr:M20 family metallo-hydrolase [Cupriavidus pampae]CAG9186454.1 N-carbamoyl-L-amino-acid hydrolase [Cupriavidus pampae]
MNAPNQSSDLAPVDARISGQRLWERLCAMAEIGATAKGGVNRQALTNEDTRGRMLLLEWATARGYQASIDPIGNLFIRRAGRNPALSPVMTGSHLDSQPTGGKFDGVYGVLAGLEVFETLDDYGVTTERPMELVVWMNEEGSRFPPPTMGSAVAAGALPLAEALAIRDVKGADVASALQAQIVALPPLGQRELGIDAHAYIEAHIEQGPVLENETCDVGIVTGIQGLHAYEIQLIGAEAHAGTTPLRHRKDALVAATALIARIRAAIVDPLDVLRFTVGRFEVYPGSPNTVPGKVTFNIDLRHPDAAHLLGAGDKILQLCQGEIEGCPISAKVLLRSTPVSFDARVVGAVRDAANARGMKFRDIVSGATHDAKYTAQHVPTGMVFVPCEKGISHNEAESARPVDVAAGAQVLCDAMLAIMSA